MIIYWLVVLILSILPIIKEEFTIDPFPLTLGYELRFNWLVTTQLT